MKTAHAFHTGGLASHADLMRELTPAEKRERLSASRGHPFNDPAKPYKLVYLPTALGAFHGRKVEVLAEFATQEDAQMCRHVDFGDAWDTAPDKANYYRLEILKADS